MPTRNWHCFRGQSSRSHTVRVNSYLLFLLATRMISAQLPHRRRCVRLNSKCCPNATGGPKRRTGTGHNGPRSLCTQRTVSIARWIAACILRRVRAEPGAPRLTTFSVRPAAPPDVRRPLTVIHHSAGSIHRRPLARAQGSVFGGL
jgi:hypothetical protein